MSMLQAESPRVSRNTPPDGLGSPARSGIIRIASTLPWPHLLSTALAAVMLLWLCYSSAQLFWILLPAPAPLPGDPTQALNQASLPRSGLQQALVVDIDRLAGLPFASGNAVAAAAPGLAQRADSAQATALALSLRGTVPSSDASASRAIIAEGDVQNFVVPGELLPITTQGVSLVQVGIDHVILDNNGRRETLWMDPGAAQRSAPLPAADALTSPGARTNSTSAAAPSLPPVFAQAANVSLQQTADGQQGLLVSAKGDGRLFRRLGLRNGDVLLSINALSLFDPALSASLLQSLQNGNAALQLLRDDVLMTVSLDLSTLDQSGE